MPDKPEYCMFCGRLGECEALCRPLTVKDALECAEVRALALRYLLLAKDAYSEFSNTRSPNPVNGMFPNDAEIVAPFLAAMEKKL